MLKGKMEFRLGSEQRVCGPGDVVVIPGGTEHEAWFHEDRDRRGARRGGLGPCIRAGETVARPDRRTRCSADPGFR